MNLISSTNATEHSRAAERTAWVFYVVAALASTIGQVWVGVTTIPKGSVLRTLNTGVVSQFGQCWHGDKVGRAEPWAR